MNKSWREACEADSLGSSGILNMRQSIWLRWGALQLSALPITLVSESLGLGTNLILCWLVRIAWGRIRRIQGYRTFNRSSSVNIPLHYGEIQDWTSGSGQSPVLLTRRG